MFRLVFALLLLFPGFVESANSTCTFIPLPGNGRTFMRCTTTYLSEILDQSVLVTAGMTYSPTAIRTMDLSNIQSTTMEANTFEAYTQLSSLILRESSSNITFERGSLKGLDLLQTLTIQDTKLPLLSAGAFEGFDAEISSLSLTLESSVSIQLNPDLESIFSELLFWALTGSVHCDCRVLWLKPILNSFTYSAGMVTCFSSVPILSGVDIMAANDSVLNSSCQDICTTRLNSCHDDATCTSQSATTFICTCNEGFQGDGFNCTDINECRQNTTCPAKSSCMNMIGGYLCLCEANRTLVGSQCVCVGNLMESNVTGECECPPGLSLGNSSGFCECQNEDMVYSSTSQACECTGNRTQNGTECVCRSGFIEDVDSGDCLCSPGLEYSTSEEICTCLRQHTVFNSTLMQCVCDSNSTRVNDDCVCKERFTEDVESGDCVCLSGLEYEEQEGTCSCPYQNMMFNTSSGECVCRGNRTLSGSECQCREGFREESGVCVCLEGLEYSGVEGACTCPGANMAYNVSSNVCECVDNRTFNGSTCVCSEGFTEDTGTGLCVCRPGLEYVAESGSCVCIGENMVLNTSSGECVCDGNRTLNSSVCVCGEGFELSADGTKCLCVAGLQYSSLNQACVCPVSDMVYSAANESCECTGNRTFNGVNCVCKDGFEEEVPSRGCVCLTGLEYILSTGVCDCGSPLMVYNASQGRCQCSRNYALEGGECVCKSNLVADVNSGGCVCANGMRYSPSIELCLSECSPPEQPNNVTGLCECPIGDDGCPSLIESLLNTLNENTTSEALQTVVLSTLSELESGSVYPNDTDNLIDLVTSSTAQLLQISTSDTERTEDIVEAILNITSTLLTGENVPLLRDSVNVNGHVGDLLTVVHNLGVALVPLADHASSGVVEVKSDSITLRVVSLSASSTSSWINVSSSPAQGGQEAISFLVLPRNLANRSNCSAAVVSGVVSGLHLVLPEYSNFSSVPNAEDRILSGLCPARGPPVEPTSSLNSVILISSLYAECGVNTSFLDPPVRISLHHEQSNFVRPHCVADSSRQFGSGLQWSEDGCRVVSTSATRTECSCSHLTSFAILMHPSRAVEENTALGIATKVGLCISIVCLLVTVVIMFGVKVKSEMIKVHRQLALSLLLTEVVFLVGVDRNAVPSPDGLCTTFAAVLHYLLLVTFSWMLIEGVHILVYLIAVFFSSKVYILYYFLGWGIPLPIVALSLGLRFCDYGSSTYCWISDDVAIWAFRAPVMLVLAVNLVILVVTITVVVKEKRKRDKDVSAVVESLRTAVVLFPVLGLCWLMGLFIFGDNATYTDVIGWIFFLLVVLQGILIFVFNCFLKKEVRTAVLKKLGYEKHKLNRNLGSGTTRSSPGTIVRTLKKKFSTSAFSTQSRKDSTSSTASTTPLQLKVYDCKDTSLGDGLSAIHESTEKL